MESWTQLANHSDTDSLSFDWVQGELEEKLQDSTGVFTLFRSLSLKSLTMSSQKNDMSADMVVAGSVHHDSYHVPRAET